MRCSVQHGFVKGLLDLGFPYFSSLLSTFPIFHSKFTSIAISTEVLTCTGNSPLCGSCSPTQIIRFEEYYTILHDNFRRFSCDAHTEYQAVGIRVSRVRRIRPRQCLFPAGQGPEQEVDQYAAEPMRRFLAVVEGLRTGGRRQAKIKISQ